MQRPYRDAGAGRRPSAWILFLLLLALMGLSLVHEPEADGTGVRAGPPWHPRAEAGLDKEAVPPEGRERSPKGEVKKDGGP